MQCQVNCPEELPLRAVILVVVWEVQSEGNVLLADAVVKGLQILLGVVYWLCVSLLG